MMISKQINAYIKCLKDGEYFKAHEMLEVIWYPRRFDDDDEIKLIKGFINAAVCFELIKRKKNKQGKRVWQNYLKYRLLLDDIDSKDKNSYLKLSRIVEKKMASLSDG